MITIERKTLEQTIRQAAKELSNDEIKRSIAYNRDGVYRTKDKPESKAHKSYVKHVEVLMTLVQR